MLRPREGGDLSLILKEVSCHCFGLESPLLGWRYGKGRSQSMKRMWGLLRVQWEHIERDNDKIRITKVAP